MKISSGQWVTINGTHVFIQNGRVAKGPKNMIGLTKEGVAKKIANPKSRPDKKKHEGRKSSYQKTLEKELGYSETKARQADKNMKEFSKLTPAQRTIYKSAYKEYFDTHKRPTGHNANTYAIKMAKSNKAKKAIKNAQQSAKIAKTIINSGSLSGNGTIKTNTKTGKSTFYNKHNYKEALSKAGLNGAFTTFGDDSLRSKGQSAKKRGKK